MKKVTNRAATTVLTIAMLILACSGPQTPPSDTQVPAITADQLVDQTAFNKNQARARFETRWYQFTDVHIT